jgi:hypothetical protein
MPYLCGQPAQQHGLRMPLRILSKPTTILLALVSSFFAEITQHIHSLRANGVNVFQASANFGSVSNAVLKSFGNL